VDLATYGNLAVTSDGTSADNFEACCEALEGTPLVLHQFTRARGAIALFWCRGAICLIGNPMWPDYREVRSANASYRYTPTRQAVGTETLSHMD
jgi:hypothetical protein